MSRNFRLALSDQLLHLNIVHMLYLLLISPSRCGINMRPNRRSIRQKPKKILFFLTFGPPGIHIFVLSKFCVFFKNPSAFSQFIKHAQTLFIINFDAKD
jgi:hypothetical protein